jgi:hypothetical protein
MAARKQVRRLSPSANVRPKKGGNNLISLEDEPYVRVQRQKLLEFFDQRQSNEGFGTHTSGINTWIGEDLVLGLYMHYYESLGAKILGISYKCTTGRKKGHQLDAWILAKRGRKRILLQVEVKNWAANAIGGEQVDFDPAPGELRRSANKIFKRYFADKKVKGKVHKVFDKMRRPEDCVGCKVLPVLAVWSVIAEGNRVAPCFRVMNRFHNKTEFPRLEIFSASLYLRKIRAQTLTIRMPRFRRRENKVGELIISGDRRRRPADSRPSAHKS